MAVKMPSIEVIFKQLAGSLIDRSERSIAILIIKDDTNQTIYKKYKDITQVDADKKIYTAENLRYIKDVLIWGVMECHVVRVCENTNLNDALKIIEKKVKTGWITIADGTSEDFESITSWIKSKEGQNKTYKAVVYKVAVTDCKHIVNFYNDKVTFADEERGEQDGYCYCPSLIGILAKCNIKKGCTYFKCSNLVSVKEVEENDKALSDGKFILFHDDEVVRVGAGINSMTTTDGLNNTEDMKYIETVEAMDIINDDISKVFKQEYLGNYRNNYDNQILFISAINTYFKELANDYVLDNNYNNKADVDVEAQRGAWLGVGKTEAEYWDEQTVKNNAFKRTVYLAGDIKILGSMENLKFTVTLF